MMDPALQSWLKEALTQQQLGIQYHFEQEIGKLELAIVHRLDTFIDECSGKKPQRVQDQGELQSRVVEEPPLPLNLDEPLPLISGTAPDKQEVLSPVDGERTPGSASKAVSGVPERSGAVTGVSDGSGGIITSFVQEAIADKEATSIRNLLSPDAKIDTKMGHLKVESALDILAGIFIFTSSIIMFVELEIAGYEAAAALDMNTDRHLEGSKAAMHLANQCFAVFFLLELCIRIAIRRLAYLHDFANWIDVVVVATSLMEWGMEGAQNLGFARLLRLAKLMKSFRFLRALKMFHQMRVLIYTMLGSFLSLASSMAVICVLLVVGGLFMCQSLHDFIMDQHEDIEMRHFAYNRFGSAGRAVYTMFEVTFAGNWPVTARPVIERISTWYSVFFLMYIVIVVFAVIRIITALFLKETLQVATEDAEMMVHQKVKEKEAYAGKLRSLFMIADADGTGTVSRAEFKRIMEFPSVRPYLSVLELDVREAEGIFDLVDDGKGVVDFHEFLDGVLRLKGSARSQDVVMLMHMNNVLVEKARQIEERVDDIREEFYALSRVLGVPKIVPVAQEQQNARASL